jgi:MscS family membrane protein
MELTNQIIIILIILTATALISFTCRKVLSKLESLSTLPEWGRALAQAFYTPSLWLIWGGGILFTLDYFISVQSLIRVRHTFIVVVVVWALLIWKRSVETFLRNKVALRSSRLADEALIFGLGKMASVLIVAVGALIILDIFNIQLTAIVAFGGIGGLALGWAGKDVVVNFFGGLMVHATRPFTVGETIRSPNKNFEGIVENIGWYMTKLRTFAREPMYVPNSLFLDAIIENSGRMYNRRILQRIGLRYEDIKKVEPVCKAICQMLKEHKEIDQEQIIVAQMVGYGPYSLDIDVICFTKTIKRLAWLSIQHDILLKIAEIVNSLNAEFALQTNTIHLHGSSSSS